MKVNSDLSGANGCLATRIYDFHLQATHRYLLRFRDPSQLQSFLADLNNIRVYGQHIKARIFTNDADRSILRPGTLIRESIRPDNILRHRQIYFQDITGKGAIVLVEGIPMFATLGMITYQMQVLLANEHFEWAYEWVNRPGAGDRLEPNAVLIGVQYDVRKS